METQESGAPRLAPACGNRRVSGIGMSEVKEEVCVPRCISSRREEERLQLYVCGGGGGGIEMFQTENQRG